MSNLLKKIDFGNEAADDVVPEELAEYFVEKDDFQKFLDHRNKILIATARKGVGKSALLQWISHKVSQQDTDALVIRCRGADLVRSLFGLSSELLTPNDHIRDWMVRICGLVNRRLAQSLNIALTDDQITLIETAELDGYKSRNLIGCLLDRFQSFLPNEGKTAKLRIKNELELLKRVKDRKVWILVDDLDATYQNTPSESIELATFFSACRYLTQDVKDVFIRVTLRSDVWSLIRRTDEALDKVDQYVQEILWYRRDFLHLLALRIKASLQALQIELPKVPQHVSREDEAERLLEKVFLPKMPWAERHTNTNKDTYRDKDTYRVLFTLSYERPRWAIQLCKLAQESALRNNCSLISKDHINEIWGEYGAKRIADLVAEHKHQCPQIEEVLNSFRGANRLMPRDELFRWINTHVSTHMEPTIEGKRTRSPMKIAHFLYRLGFIVARSDSTDGQYEHYRFDQMPDFLTNRTNDDFGVSWEIHPCYREALDITKVNRSHKSRFGRLRERR